MAKSVIRLLAKAGTVPLADVSALGKRSLRRAWSAERQAIAIYEAEIFILRIFRSSFLEVYREILREEREHSVAVANLLIADRPNRIIVAADFLSGWSVGILLAFLPTRWNFWAHVLAEQQAALVYLAARKSLLSSGMHVRSEAALQLAQQARQEFNHSRLFAKLLKGSH